MGQVRFRQSSYKWLGQVKTKFIRMGYVENIHAGIWDRLNLFIQIYGTG